MRQVPDNQEVFVHANSNASIIVEVLELSIESTANGAARYHFEQLAKDNGAVAADIEQSSFTEIDASPAFP